MGDDGARVEGLGPGQLNRCGPRWSIRCVARGMGAAGLPTWSNATKRSTFFSEARVKRQVRVRISPELLFGMRSEMANVLREVADAEADARVARRLREIAAAFEAGQRATE